MSKVSITELASKLMEKHGRIVYPPVCWCYQRRTKK